MPNSSKANARRKRLATAKLRRSESVTANKEQHDHRDDRLEQEVGYGHPGNLGSGSQIGSARDIGAADAGMEDTATGDDPTEGASVEEER
jgi:hypothetical protein